MAEEITVARFREIYPEFVANSIVEIEYALEFAQEIHRCSANAIYALAAHYLALAAAQGTGGADPVISTVKEVQKSRVGRITTEYVKAIESKRSSEDAYYSTTPYGKTYLALRDASLRKFATRVY